MCVSCIMCVMCHMPFGNVSCHCVIGGVQVIVFWAVTMVNGGGLLACLSPTLITSPLIKGLFQLYHKASVQCKLAPVSFFLYVKATQMLLLLDCLHYLKTTSSPMLPYFITKVNLCAQVLPSLVAWWCCLSRAARWSPPSRAAWWSCLSRAAQWSPPSRAARSSVKGHPVERFVKGHPVELSNGVLIKK